MDIFYPTMFFLERPLNASDDFLFQNKICSPQELWRVFCAHELLWHDPYKKGVSHVKFSSLSKMGNGAVIFDV